MLRLLKLYKKMFKKSKGQTALEYALIIGGVAFVLISIVRQLKDPMQAGMTDMGKKLQSTLSDSADPRTGQ